MDSVNSFKPTARSFSSPRPDLGLFEDVSAENVPGVESVNNGNSKAQSSTPEMCSFTSRCSVRLIHDLVSKFNKEKMQLVREIGFEGMLKLPLIKQINLRFSTWLMCRVDVMAQSLLISDDVRIPFNKHDVARVFGIPSYGRGICSILPSRSDQGDTSKSPIEFINTKHLRSIKTAQAIVDRTHNGVMSPRDQDEFKAAFVVLVLSNLLAPCAKHDSVCDDFFPAIQHPSQIGNFDWADYVLRRLLDAINKLKSDIVNNVKAPYLHGCYLFLQVLFLDSIDLGVLSMPHTSFPRISSFTPDRLRSMISAVITFSPSGAEVVDYSKVKMRSSAGVCYGWAYPNVVNEDAPDDEAMLAIWEAVRRMTRILNVPDEAAGPLFVATADFQRRTNPVTSTDILKHISVMFEIIEPYLNGYRYQTSLNANTPLTGSCPSGDQICCISNKCCTHFTTIGSKRKCPMVNRESSESSDICSSNKKGLYPCGSLSNEIDIRVINAMARFYLFLRPVKPTKCVDLNRSVREDESLHALSNVKRFSHHKPSRSPWDLGALLVIDIMRGSALRSKLSLIEDSDEPWIIHFCPKYIELITSAVKAQFSGQSELEMEMVDAVLRRFKQIDDGIYIREGPTRWRHFVESDFMGSMLAGCFDISHPVLRSHFCGRHIGYDVSACQMLFFPTILQHRWVCFSWRLHDNTIIVFDPCKDVYADHGVGSSYERLANLLKSAMSLVSSSMFQHWDYPWGDAVTEVFSHNAFPVKTPNQSGLLCMYFCRCFDGRRLSPNFEMDMLQDWTASLLSDLSALTPNFGTVPRVFR